MTFENLNVNNLLYNINTVNSNDNVVSYPESLSLLSKSSEISSSSIASGEVIGDLLVSNGFIRSFNYVAGTSGWTINADGTSQFSDFILIGGSLKYNKTSFTDTVNSGYYIGSEGVYFGSSNDTTKLKFTIADGSLKLTGNIASSTITGSTITGGTFQTSTSGARVVISGNDINYYDDTTGGSGSISGDVSSALFPRTDGNNGTFVIQKRASSIDDLGNVAELFFKESPISGKRNYLFLGSNGLDNSASDMNTHVIRIHSKDLFQIGSDSAFNITNGGPEFQIVTPNTPGGTAFNSGGSRLMLGACDSNTPAAYVPSTGLGGGAVLLGIQKDVGFDLSFWIDKDACYLGKNLIPYDSYNYSLGDSSHIYTNIIGQNFQLRHSDNGLYGQIYTGSGYFNIETSSNRNVKINTGTGTTYISGASIAPLTSGGASCGLSSSFWSNVYSNNYTFSNSYLNYENSGITTHTHFKPSSARSYTSGASSYPWSNVYSDAFQVTRSGSTTRYIVMNSSGNLEINTGLYVGGTLSKSAGSFTIEHPLKPETHFLQHSFVESPDMLNVYRGNGEIVNGECLIEMPDWFSPLNGEIQDDYSYQLTSIGKQNYLWVKKEMKKGKVVFAGEKDGKFSYLITAIRHDDYAEKNRIKVEIEKDEEKKKQYKNKNK